VQSGSTIDPLALTSGGIPNSRDREAVSRFAATFDGQSFFGDRCEAALERLRYAWVQQLVLPWDLGVLRAWLALEARADRFAELDDAFTVTDARGHLIHEANPDGISPAHARHELVKTAIVDRIRALVVCRERNVPAPTAEHPIRTLIPRTPMLERYLTMKASQKLRLSIAQGDAAQPKALVAAFHESVARFGVYANVDEPFHDERPDPVPGPDLWRGDDVAGRLKAMGDFHLTGSVIKNGKPPASADLTVAYVGREIIAARTTTIPTHRMQRVQLVRHDLLLRSCDEGLPVVAEIKTPTDQDAYYALIQLLAAASQMVTPNQRQRLRRHEPKAGFAEADADARVDLALVFVDPDRCDRVVEPTKSPQLYRPALDSIAPQVAQLLLTEGGIGQYVRRIFRADVGLRDGQLEGAVVWAFEAPFVGRM